MWDVAMIICLIKLFHKMVMAKVHTRSNKINFSPEEWQTLATKINDAYPCKQTKATPESVRAKIQHMKGGCSDMMTIMADKKRKKEQDMWSDIIRCTTKRSVTPSFGSNSPVSQTSSSGKQTSSSTIKKKKQCDPNDISVAKEVLDTFYAMGLSEYYLDKAMRFLEESRDTYWNILFLNVKPAYRLKFLKQALKKYKV